MGVLGLWETLESVGHPIKIEGLEGKVLGVDANIWLYKFIRGFREKDNATNIESHKLGLFNRIAKLLFYRIKPVFVFDGPAPVLKRRTLERRQNIRNKHLTKVQDAAMRILADQLKSQYPDADIDHLKITMPNLVSNNLVAAEKLTDEDRDLFYLPETGKLTNDDSDSEESDIVNILDDRQYVTTEVDINSKDFEHLPAETRYEILHDIKQSRKRIRNPAKLPEDANSFSNFQLERLKARRTVQEKIEKCEKEICTNYTGELADGSSIQAFRVQSDARATILYRNNTYDPKALEKVKQEENSTPEEEVKEEDKTNKDDSDINGKSLDRSQSSSQSKSTSWIRHQEVNINGLANRLKSYKPNEDPGQFKVVSPNLSSPDPSSPDPKSPDLSSTDVSSPDSSHNESQSHQSDKPEQPEHISLAKSCPRPSDQLLAEPESSKSESSVVETLVSDEDNTSDDEIIECPQPSATVTIRNSTTDAHNDSDISIIYDNNNRTITIDSEGDMTNRTEIIDDSEDSDSEDENLTDSIEPKSQPSEQIQESLSSATTSATILNPEIASISSEDESIVSELKSTTSSSANVVSAPGSQQTEQAATSSKQTTQNETGSSQTSRPASQSQPYRPPTPTRTNKVTNKIVEDAKELLRLFGIPYIDATGEAEAQCAKLEELKLTEGTITDDSDIWLFGSQNVYRYFFNDDKYVMQYKMKDIEFHVRMTRENLVCFAMMVGSDYTDGIMNVGPVTALEVLSEFPGEGLDPLEQFRDWHREAVKDIKAAKKDKKRRKLLKYRLPEEFPSRAVYDGYLRPVADTSAEKFTWGVPELDELREYARRNFGWDPKKVDDKLIPVMKRLNEKKVQKTIDTFFFKTQANRNPEMFRSKRVNQALNKIAKRAAREEKVSVPEVCNLSEDED